MTNRVVKRFGLCGYPIAHSLSPSLFDAAYPQGDYSYELIQASNPEEAIRLFLEGGFTGINVTSPFKTSILPFTHHQTEECAAIGACNLILKKGGLLIAHNTDYIGVSGCLSKANIPLQHTACLLLGAGGAGRAAAYTLLKAGALLFWANRTPSRIPESFCSHRITPLPLTQMQQYLSTCGLIVNTLPLPIPETQNLRFNPHQTILDASYLTRPLKQQALHADALYISGERWLLHQALFSFRAMTGLDPNTAAMEQIMR